LEQCEGIGDGQRAEFEPQGSGQPVNSLRLVIRTAHVSAAGSNGMTCS
jgi:hypothetical protein